MHILRCLQPTSLETLKVFVNVTNALVELPNVGVAPGNDWAKFSACVLLLMVANTLVS